MKQTSETVFMNGTNSNDIMLFGDIVYMNGAEGGGSQYPAWENMPSDWSDIRLDCPKNSIALYAGHTADYSQYDNLGFTASCTGGYNVFIDGNVYGSYASGSTCSITWSTSGITTGDDITTPTALKAHKIWISPATSGNNITAFKCARVAESGQEVQGLLWEHFNLTNSINIQELNATGSLASSNYSNPALVACTAKNNTLNFSEINRAFLKCEKLTYVPTFNFTGSSSINASFVFTNCSLLESVVLKDLLFYSASYTFYNCYKLKKVLGIKYTSARNMDYFITKSTDLKDTVVDVSSANYLKTVGCFGTSSYFMGGLKGLRVSSSAPFDATAPQINVSYTGMDRTALVQLFNDLPYNSVGYTVVGSPTITNGVATGFSQGNDIYVLQHPIDEIHSFKIKCKFKINSFTNESYTNIYGQYLSNYNTPQLMFTRNEKHLFVDFPKNATQWGNKVLTSMDLSINQDYWSIVSWDDNTNTCKLDISTDGINYTTIGTAQNTAPFWTGKMAFGSDWYSNYNRQASFLNGEIDFNYTNIEVNGEVWFDGTAALNKTISCVNAYGDSVILSNVGEPTIVDDVITRMDKNNFVKTSSFAIGDSANWSAEIPVLTGNDVNSEQNFFSENTHYSFSCGVKSSKFAYSLSRNGSSWTTSGEFGSHTLQPNTLYYWKAEYNATTKVFNVYVKEEGGTYELDYTNSDGIKAPTQYLQFGVSRSSSLPWLGSIVLKDVVINVNDTVWLADGNFLYPADKAIAINKGWTLLVQE